MSVPISSMERVYTVDQFETDKNLWEKISKSGTYVKQISKPEGKGNIYEPLTFWQLIFAVVSKTLFRSKFEIVKKVDVQHQIEENIAKKYTDFASFFITELNASPKTVGENAPSWGIKYKEGTKDDIAYKNRLAAYEKIKDHFRQINRIQNEAVDIFRDMTDDDQKKIQNVNKNVYAAAGLYKDILK